jgi:two-component system cell cycle sensor histidine kinase/response regulator CckA
MRFDKRQQPGLAVALAASQAQSPDSVPVEEALQKSEERLRAIFDSSAIGICVADMGGRVIETNRAFEEIVGYSAGELRELAFAEYTHPEDVPANLVLWNSLVAGERDSYELEKRYCRKDGSVVWAHLTVNRLQSLNGSDELCLVMVQDITTRKRAEEELRGAERRYRALVEGLPLVTYIDAADETSSAIYMSPQIEPLLGYTVEDWINDPDLFPKLLHPDDRERVMHEVALDHAEGGRFSSEYRLVAKDGRVVWFRDESAMVYDDDGVPLYSQGFLLDITRQNALEEELRQSHKMEAIGRLAGGIAHDFNNLLTAISGYSELLLSALDADDPRRRDADEIKLAAERAASLTRQLLTFSRRQLVQPTVADLNGIIREMDGMLRRLIAADIELETALDDDVGAVKVDLSQIQQVVLNLVINARDAMRSGGTLTIRTFNANIAEPPSAEGETATGGPYVVLAVEDDGCGMDEATKAHLFEPFFTTKEPGEGTGLGLSTVYGIVTQSGGFISVVSEPGQGSRFEIALPRADLGID